MLLIYFFTKKQNETKKTQNWGSRNRDFHYKDLCGYRLPLLLLEDGAAQTSSWVCRPEAALPKETQGPPRAHLRLGILLPCHLLKGLFCLPCIYFHRIFHSPPHAKWPSPASSTLFPLSPPRSTPSWLLSHSLQQELLVLSSMPYALTMVPVGKH